MEVASHKSEGILKVERSFAWSRLESQVMASAYECLMPITRRLPVAEQERLGSRGVITEAGGELRHATGA